MFSLTQDRTKFIIQNGVVFGYTVVDRVAKLLLTMHERSVYKNVAILKENRQLMQTHSYPYI